MEVQFKFTKLLVTLACQIEGVVLKCVGRGGGRFGPIFCDVNLYLHQSPMLQLIYIKKSKTLEHTKNESTLGFLLFLMADFQLQQYKTS